MLFSCVAVLYICIGMTVVAATTAANSSNSNYNQNSVNRNLVSVSASSTVNHAPFADALTSKMYTNDNECTSSFGISMVFSLLYPASDATNEEQMRDTFGYPSGQSKANLVWNSTASNLDDKNQGQCITQGFNEQCNRYAPIIEISNSIWIDNAVDLEPIYESIVGEEIIQRLDFADENSGNRINSWVNESTSGLIDDIVDDGPLPSDLIMVAINSIYLKASWLKQFKDIKTNEDISYMNPSRTETGRNAHFMHQVGYFSYSDKILSGYQVVKLPFAGTSFESGLLSMVLVLPITDDTSNDIVESEDVLPSLLQLQSTYLALGLPKFKFESKYESNTLVSALKSLGLTAPFEGGLCITADEICNTAIKEVIHKTVIGIDEKGVEAAAVSVISITAVSLPPNEATLFLADHPFQFFIHDEKENIMIFEGRVGDPGVIDGSTTPQLQAIHSESNFWNTNFGVNIIDSDAAPNEFFNCFSARTNAVVEGIGRITMNQIKVGDRVLTGSGVYQTIYAIDHRHESELAAFVQIYSSSNEEFSQEEPIELTKKHMIFLNNGNYPHNKPVPAGTVKVGDKIQALSGLRTVTKICTVIRKGVFSPLTVDGTIIVNDGIIASTYSAVGSSSRSGDHKDDHLEDGASNNAEDDVWIILPLIGDLKIDFLKISHQDFYSTLLQPYRILCIHCCTNSSLLQGGETLCQPTSKDNANNGKIWISEVASNVLEYLNSWQSKGKHNLQDILWRFFLSLIVSYMYAITLFFFHSGILFSDRFVLLIITIMIGYNTCKKMEKANFKKLHI